jgi:hypothetical protein
MINNTNAPISVDYTNRDYYSLREQLITRVNTQIQEWTGQDPADFGLAMVESFAYVGDIVAYYIDRIANEGFLLTATQRQSLLDLAAIYGYTPSGFKNSFVTVKFINSSSSNVVIPGGTQISGDVVTNDVVEQLIFTTMENSTVNANSFAFITAYHGENISQRDGNEADPLDAFDVAGEVLGISDGLPQQSFVLSENQVVDDSIVVYVKTGSITQPWTRASHIADYGPQDSVYSVSIDADNYVYVTFGDGVSGAIPPSTSVIKVEYTVGGGVVGNIPTSILDSIIKIPGLTDSQTSAIASVISVDNTTIGSGGADPESNTQIRTNAPLALSSTNRAVSLKDYSDVALTTSGVGKAKAEADVWSSVNVYVGPEQSDTDSNLYPLFTDVSGTLTLNSVEWATLKAKVVESLQDRTQIGASVTISPPAYIKSAIGVSYTLASQAVQAQVETAIKNALTTAFSYNYASFGTIITPEEVESVVRSITGVYNARVTALYRLSGSSARNTLVGAANEIFTFAEESLSVTLASSNATVSNITTSVGTLTPAFTAAISNYNIVGASAGSASIGLTRTNANSVIYVNGTLVSGSTYAATLASGTNTLTVSVLAQDNYTSKTYTITAIV